MNTQNKKQFEPVKLTLSKEVVMVLNEQKELNNSTTNGYDETQRGCATSNEQCGLLYTLIMC